MPSRLPEPSDLEQIAEMIRRLNYSGWSVGSAAFATTTGLGWRIFGTNGENLIRAEGPTELEAWRAAIEQARAMGMLAPE
jgi:hypothetical protein